VKKHNTSQPHRFNKIAGVLVKFFIIAAIIFLALFFITSYIYKILGASDYFKIKEIITRDNSSVNLSYLKGKNIFRIDVEGESRYILESFPNYGRINLVRVLPDRIFVDFVERQPQALLKFYKYFALDKEGVLFTPSSQDLQAELPVILGLETKIFGPKPGKKYNLKEINLVLNIIKEMNTNKTLKDYKIKKIDVTNPSNSTVFIALTHSNQDISVKKPQARPEELLEVRVGGEGVKDKFAVLAGIINQEKLNLTKIKYIDLRFKESVIKLREATTYGTK